MRRKILIGLFVFLATAVQANAAWSWPPTDTEVFPPNPTSSGVVSITLSGEWRNSCIPNDSAIFVAGDEIFFDVIWDYPPNVVCLMVISSWARTESAGPLSPGAYSVYARLIGYHGIPETYTLVTEFIVVESPVPEIEIEVQPYRDQKRIVAKPLWPFAMAALGSEAVDVRDVDVTTLAFGPGEASPALDLTDPSIYQLSLQDVNDDEEDDLVAVFLYGETELPLGESEACLTGEIAGEQFEACDTALVVPWGCGLGFELLFILPPLIWLRGRRRRSLT